MDESTTMICIVAATMVEIVNTIACAQKLEPNWHEQHSYVRDMQCNAGPRILQTSLDSLKEQDKVENGHKRSDHNEFGRHLAVRRAYHPCAGALAPAQAAATRACHPCDMGPWKVKYSRRADRL